MVLTNSHEFHYIKLKKLQKIMIAIKYKINKYFRVPEVQSEIVEGSRKQNKGLR